MQPWIVRWALPLALVLVILLPERSSAPLVYRPGEGWTYEAVGGGKWQRTRAKDQLEVAQEAFTNKNYGVALKASRRVVKVWPLSDSAPQAQYLVGRCYEEKRQDQKAFKEYQKLVEKYPKAGNYQEVLKRQFEIANRFLGGQWFKLWGYIPVFPSMDKTAQMFEKIVKNGPYSDVAPQAQMNIGAARENQVSFFNRVDPFREAVKAYEQAADRYRDNKPLAADAVFKAGLAYHKQAQKAEYDQSVAGQAIATFNDFMILFPNDGRIPEAQRLIRELKTEQSRGNYQIARYYEKRKKWDGALVYYNEAALRDPNSSYAEEARKRMEDIRKRMTETAPPAPAPTP